MGGRSVDVDIRYELEQFDWTRPTWGGRVSMMFVDILTGLPHVNGNALRALAVTTKDRSPLAPHLPSMQEAGVPDFDISSWQGYFGPAGMPKEIVTRLNTEI
ncbi:tripartite tricarboxylate transporter substrate-binding protein, partial [Sphingobium sp.]|uniref:tripartite tricarboxylate transporter substrate-binding protein n=1 Tax=Sphingobium sp. TaxID=1912891 RepID=UPI0035C76198